MKKLILILTLIFTTSLYSQYNLVFNKVVNEQLGNGQTEITVPDGKVWKIQGFQHNGTGNTNSPYAYPFSITKPDGTYLSYTQVSGSQVYNGAIWASEGDKISMAGSLPNSSNLIAVNALEFNLSSATSSGGGSGSGGSESGGSSSTNNGSGVTFNNNAGVPGDDFTDLDGNTYGTTNINGMIWTTSNYEGSTYSDGTPIPYISDWNEWKEATTGAYTYWTQDSSLGYGKIYNMHAIRGRHDDDNLTPNKKFAPDGWHIPTKSETDYLSNLYNSNVSLNSFYLKSATEWAGGANGTNTSGLDIKPYGGIYGDAESIGFTTDDGNNSVYGQIGGFTHIWGATPYQNDATRKQYHLYFTVDGADFAAIAYSYTPYLAGNVSGENNYLNWGAYVRLVKDY